MVVLSNPGTYCTRKCSSWFADVNKSKDPEYKHPEIPHSKNPKMQNFLHLWNLAFFGVFGFLDFLFFTLVCPICRNSSKIGFGKNGVCIGIYSVFKGCACRSRGVTKYF